MALIYVSAWSDADIWRAEVAKHLPGETLRVWPDVGNVDEIDVALVWKPPHGSLATLPALKLIVNMGVGVDSLLQDPNLPRHVPLVRLVDPLMTEQMTEYVVLGVLAGFRKLLDYRALQAEGRWVEIDRDVAPPSERVVGILGQGELGTDAARKFLALGYKVAGWSRSPKHILGVESFHGQDRLHAFLGRCDAVVCLLPLTPETRGIVNARTIAAMKKGAWFVNGARGGQVVDADLLAALDSGHLSGAFLDVFNEEPLPPSHPYWRHPKVIATPHIAALTLPSMSERIMDAVKRYKAGKPLINVVDLERGY
jgi:glyoxylate/hydroxypyruvate reductase